MAFFKTVSLLKQLARTEVIFNNILKENIPLSQVADKYLEKLRNENINSNKDENLFEFRYKAFSKLSKNKLENIITETYNIVKDKNSSFYLNLLHCCISNKIEFDINSILKDMMKNEIAFNQNICSMIIQYYSERAEIKALEILLVQMKSKGIYCSNKDKYMIVSGYIIARQPEKAEIFIKENNLDMTSHNMFYSRCFGYASIGDVASLKHVLAEMKEKNLTFSARRNFNLYERLVYGNVDKSDLQEFIDLIKESLVEKDVHLHLNNLISNLNRSYYFNDSIIVLEKLADCIENASLIIEYFDRSACPINTFKQALTLLLPRCRQVSYKKCIFEDIDFDTAYDICEQFSKFEKWNVIYYSILNKAIRMKSLPSVEKAIDFAVSNLNWFRINHILYYVVFPSMLENKMVSNYGEILKLLPAYKHQLLPVVLMKYLCSGDFDGYNQMIAENQIKRLIQLNYNQFANELRDNFTLKEMKIWLTEAKKSFVHEATNSILSQVFIEEVKRLTQKESNYSIEEIIGYGKEWEIELWQSDIEYLLKLAPEVSELIQSSIVTKNNSVEELSN